MEVCDDRVEPCARHNDISEAIRALSSLGSGTTAWDALVSDGVRIAVGHDPVVLSLTERDKLLQAVGVIASALDSIPFPLQFRLSDSVLVADTPIVQDASPWKAFRSFIAVVAAAMTDCRAAVVGDAIRIYAPE